ncbi:MAG: alpha/beta fold hydrolase [Akkermansiaceae bacterium]|nr:alpha/beta fold hydrolase [Akkermansiaceae bacterium]NNM31384.1 alpha/beta fold hydrolase [Akkermansiaceae bacterium]
MNAPEERPAAHPRRALRPRKGHVEISASERLACFDSQSPRAGNRPGPPILLLHGFTADKGSWLRMVRQLGKNHRVIALDFAGHGASSNAADDDYGRVRQAERAHLLAAQLHLGTYHVVGHSMGGAVAATLAIAHPEEVLSLGLISPAGLPDPHTAEFNALLAKGVNPLVVSGNWSGGERIRFVTNGPWWLHLFARCFSGVLSRRARERAPLYLRMFEQLGQEAPLAATDLQGIRQPTFLLWGTGDRVLDPARAEEFESNIPDIHVERREGIGHTPGVEEPRRTAKAYLAFLQSLQAS